MGRERRVSERGQPVDYMEGILCTTLRAYHVLTVCTYHVLIMYSRSTTWTSYMEGLAKNLPRVLYLLGAGQEVIQFE